ncbi:MAG: type VI secretion system baseplate subunit TssK, partial [Pseudomonadota bacterium]
KLVLDDDFIPSYIDCSQSTVLDGFLREIVGLLDQRAEAIAARINPSARAGAAETADYLMLMVINRHRPLLAHYIAMKSVHPETLYMFLLGLLGEFAIFSSEDRRPKKFDPYDHADLTATFKPVMQELRQALSMVLEQKAINLPFKVHRYGIRVAQLADKSLLQDAMFVVSMSADVGDEVLRRTFPAQVKIGSVEMIRELVNVALPGIRVRVLPVAPRQIPFHTGKLYFALEQTGKYWDALAKSGGIALHLSGDFPNLEIDLWAIRE